MTMTIGSFPDSQNVLCVFAPLRIHPRWERWVAGKPLHQCDLTALSYRQKALLWKPYQHYLRSNPRPPEYMAHLLAEFIRTNAPAANVHILLNGWTPDVLPAEWRGRVGSKEALRNRTFDAALLLYPDPTGYGWSRMERELRRWNISATWVLNGRRRSFPLNSYFRRNLRLRRFLEATWLGELLMFSVLLPVSAVLVLWDGARRLFRTDLG